MGAVTGLEPGVSLAGREFGVHPSPIYDQASFLTMLDLSFCICNMGRDASSYLGWEDRLEEGMFTVAH